MASSTSRTRTQRLGMSLGSEAIALARGDPAAEAEPADLGGLVVIDPGRAPDSAAGRVIAAWPSFGLIAAYELLMRQVRRHAASGAGTLQSGSEPAQSSNSRQ